MAAHTITGNRKMPNYREVAMSLKNPARGAAGFPDISPL
jgi:hypothetical protein